MPTYLDADEAPLEWVMCVEAANRLATTSRFFLFGMGNRRKLIYQAGRIIEAFTGETVRQWDVVHEEIDPAGYCVRLETTGNKEVTIREDEEGVWVVEGSDRTPLSLSRLHLPCFEGHPYASDLRILHHEVLINIVDGKPLPNLFVYHRPWIRDAAMMAMVLEKTGNLFLLEDWVMGLRYPFDRNNQGIPEPDNIGQALYLVGLFADSSHPLVEAALAAVQEFQQGRYICGLTDFAEHPVYQTKWLKFGLQRLGLPDPFSTPEVPDSYSALLGWTTETLMSLTLASPETAALYPYLAWAEAHFYGDESPMSLKGKGYPQSWEAQASQADYEGMRRLGGEFTAKRIAVPHAWHDAEMFLYLLERTVEGKGTRSLR
ncbi:MAG: hypothetical protein ACUVRR_00790 [Candidatus Fervidibacter sp.]|uniref:hypothetical protein n=1 Tax=Candidatus Fervidibacter sp. TaxID=3100871 RepID=UPI00404A1079